jgi:hypothetical protein
VRAIELASRLFPADQELMLSINFMPNAVYEPAALVKTVPLLRQHSSQDLVRSLAGHSPDQGLIAPDAARLGVVNRLEGHAEIKVQPGRCGATVTSQSGVLSRVTQE